MEAYEQMFHRHPEWYMGEAHLITVEAAPFQSELHIRFEQYSHFLLPVHGYSKKLGMCEYCLRTAELAMMYMHEHVFELMKQCISQGILRDARPNPSLPILKFDRLTEDMCDAIYPQFRLLSMTEGNPVNDEDKCHKVCMIVCEVAISSFLPILIGKYLNEINVLFGLLKPINTSGY